VYGSAISFIFLFPAGVFFGAIWLWFFIKGFIGAAIEHIRETEGGYVSKD
jgi:hypothetical protein